MKTVRGAIFTLAVMLGLLAVEASAQVTPTCNNNTTGSLNFLISQAAIRDPTPQFIMSYFTLSTHPQLEADLPAC